MNAFGCNYVRTNLFVYIYSNFNYFCGQFTQWVSIGLSDGVVPGGSKHNLHHRWWVSVLYHTTMGHYGQFCIGKYMAGVWSCLTHGYLWCWYKLWIIRLQYCVSCIFYFILLFFFHGCTVSLIVVKATDLFVFQICWQLFYSRDFCVYKTQSASSESSQWASHSQLMRLSEV